MVLPYPESPPDIGGLLACRTYDFEYGDNRIYLKKNNELVLPLKHAD